MGIFPYNCPRCGGAYKRCGVHHSKDDVDNVAKSVAASAKQVDTLKQQRQQILEDKDGNLTPLGKDLVEVADKHKWDGIEKSDFVLECIERGLDYYIAQAEKMRDDEQRELDTMKATGHCEGSQFCYADDMVVVPMRMFEEGSELPRMLRDLNFDAKYNGYGHAIPLVVFHRKSSVIDMLYGEPYRAKSLAEELHVPRYTYIDESVAEYVQGWFEMKHKNDVTRTIELRKVVLC